MFLARARTPHRVNPAHEIGILAGEARRQPGEGSKDARIVRGPGMGLSRDPGVRNTRRDPRSAARKVPWSSPVVVGDLTPQLGTDRPIERLRAT